MKWYGITLGVIFLAIVLILLAAVVPPAYPPQPGTPGGGELRISDPLFIQNATTAGNTAFFSKYVSEETPFILVDLYSGDPGDPLALTVITPDKTLGPFDDTSDGRMDGRIFIKISRDDRMTPGLWKFEVHSRKNISAVNYTTFLEVHDQLVTNRLKNTEQ